MVIQMDEQMDKSIKNEWRMSGQMNSYMASWIRGEWINS